MNAFTASARTERLTVERRTVTTNDYGDEVASWARYCSAWVNVRYGVGDERREAARTSSLQAATFGLPYNGKTKAIEMTDRLIFDGSEWNIAGKSVAGRRAGIVLTATRSK